MMTFISNLETQVKHKDGEYKIPPEMDESYIILKTGWNIFEVRACPAHIIDKLRLHWHLETLGNKEANKPPKS